MKNRGCFLLLLLLTLAGSTKTASAQTYALQVQVYDYSGLSPAALHQFVALTRQILASSGISLEVDACAGGAACESHTGSFRQVVLRVLPDADKKRKNVRLELLGVSVADHDGGTYGTVFLKPAEEKACDADLPRMVVLAYAAAHEIGHLLLGDAHSPYGLMKAVWNTNDFRAMAESNFHFDSEQARELASRYGAPLRAVASAHTEVAVGR